MKAEDVLKTASDTIIVSADEPLAQSVDRYIEAMRRQYGFTEEEVRAAVDIAVLSRRQEQLIDARIKAYIAQHPFSADMDLNAYCAPLLNGVITVEQVSRQLTAMCHADEKPRNFAPSEEQSAPARHDDALIRSLRRWSSVLLWGGIALAVLYGIGELCYLSLSSFYGSGYLYVFNLYSAAGQLAYFWMVCRPLIISAAAIVLAVIGALILKALAKILERS